MESFKIRSLSGLSSVFFSYLFSNNFYVLSVNCSQSQSIQHCWESSCGLWAWLWPSPNRNQTSKSKIIFFNLSISLAFWKKNHLWTPEWIICIVEDPKQNSLVHFTSHHSSPWLCLPRGQVGFVPKQNLQGSSSDPAIALFIGYKNRTHVWGEKRHHHQLVRMSKALGVQQDYNNSHKIQFRPQELIQKLMRFMCLFPSTAGRAIQVSTEINCC